MKQEITLEQYLRLGGELEGVNWNSATKLKTNHNGSINKKG